MTERICPECSATYPDPHAKECRFRREVYEFWQRESEPREKLIERAIDIIAGNNLDRYGVYIVDENYVRSLSDERLRAIIDFRP